MTLTLRPSSHLEMRYRAIRRFNDRGRDPVAASFEALDDDDQKRLVEVQTAREVCLYLKRLRKNTGSVFRYLVVTEVHRSGELHYHLLVHEVSGELRERSFRKEWHLGFAHAKVVQATGDRVAAYATKVARYVSKALSARVRASKRYGSVGLETVSDLSDEREDLPL